MIRFRFQICSQLIQITCADKSVTKFFRLARSRSLWVRPAGLPATAPPALYNVTPGRKFTNEPMLCAEIKC